VLPKQDVIPIPVTTTRRRPGLVASAIMESVEVDETVGGFANKK
jgi:hypothetical protein